MNIKSSVLILSLLGLTSNSLVFGQQKSQYGSDRYIPVSLDYFVSQVDGSNVNILAKRRIVDTVAAQQAPMSTPNVNPTVSFSHGSYFSSLPYYVSSGTTYPSSSPQSNTISFSGTYEGWGKLSARTNYYAAELERNTVELDSLKNAIKMDAAYSFFDTLRYKLSWNSFQSAIQKLQALKADDAVANLTRDQSNTSKDLKYYSYTMTTFMSKGQVDLLEPTGDIDKVVPRNFKLKDLIDSALANRGDVLALSQSVKSSQMALEMASKNRNMYISPSVWVSRTPSYSSSGADYNTSVASGFSITVPIPTNLLFNADITEASNNLANVEDYLADLKARVVVEVNQAYMQYGYAVDKLTAAQDDYKAAVSNAGNNVDSVLNLRDREGNLIDAKINHAKALIYLLKVSGDYKLPKI